MSNNSNAIIQWSDRMMSKTGLCGAVFCEALAEYCEESGNEDPSDHAIEVAHSWERDIRPLLTFIEDSHKWCKGTPTWGCIHNCQMWKSEVWDNLIKTEDMSHD